MWGRTSQPARLMWAGSGVHTPISAAVTVVDSFWAGLVTTTAHREVTVTVMVYYQCLSVSGLLLRSYFIFQVTIGFSNLIYE